jgi:hypothetical protein
MAGWGMVHGPGALASVVDLGMLAHRVCVAERATFGKQGSCFLVHHMTAFLCHGV